MRLDSDALQEVLLAEAKAVIQEVVKWNEEHPAPTLGQIEEAVLKFRKQFGQRVAEVLLENQEAVRPVPGPICPRCQQEMRYKWQGEIEVESAVGLLHIRRGYFYCPRCQSGIFPPGPATSVMGQTLE